MGPSPPSSVTQASDSSMQAPALLCILLASVQAAPMASAYAPISLEDQAPKPYSFQYGVKDDYANTNFAHTEAQDAQGVVKGTYVVALPDGRIQTTSYTADHLNGYIADV